MGAEKKKVVVIVVLLIFILILNYISFTSAWWNENAENRILEEDYKSSVDFKLEEIDLKLSYGTDEIEETLKYEDIEDEDSVGFKNAIELFKIIYNLMIILFILVIISIALTVLAYFKKAIFKVVSVILIITFLFAIILAIGFAVGLPMAFKQDYEDLEVEINGEDVSDQIEITEPGYTDNFAGEEKVEGGGYTWGPSTGWSLMVLVFILTGLSAIVALLPLKRPFEEKIAEPPIKIQDDYKDAIVMDEPEVTYDKTNVFECPKCGNEFKVSTPQRPVKIRCPHCKAEGTIS